MQKKKKRKNRKEVWEKKNVMIRDRIRDGVYRSTIGLEEERKNEGSARQSEVADRRRMVREEITHKALA
jgi:hypothetical protein